MDLDYGSRNHGLVSGLQSEDIMEKLQALSALFETLTFDSTAIFDYARPNTFIPLLVPLVEMNQDEASCWELDGEIAFQAARCLGLYIDSALEISSEMIMQLGGCQSFVKWLSSLEQIEFAELAITTLSSIVKEQRLALVDNNGQSISNETQDFNGLAAILRILEFLPLETQRVAMVTVKKGCHNLPAKYWHCVGEAIPLVTPFIATRDGDIVQFGLHTEMALQICATGFSSLAAPQKDTVKAAGVEESQSLKTIDDMFLEMTSHGLLDVLVAIIHGNNHPLSIVCETVYVLTILAQGSLKVRSILGSSSALYNDLCSTLVKIRKEESDDASMIPIMVLLDEILSDSISPSETPSSQSLVRVKNASEVRVFGGTDGHGAPSMLEYGVEVPLLLTWVSESGDSRHLVGVPSEVQDLYPPILEASCGGVNDDKVSEVSANKIEALGWVHGEPFVISSPSFISQLPIILKDSVEPNNIVGTLCKCLCVSRRVDPIPKVALRLLRCGVQIFHHLNSELQGEDGVAAILISTLASQRSTLAALEIINLLLFSDTDPHPDFQSRYQVLEYHGILSFIAQLADTSEVPLSSGISKVDLFHRNKGITEAHTLSDRIKQVTATTPTTTLNTPLEQCCAKFKSLMELPKESSELIGCLEELLGFIPQVTPFVWNSAQLTPLFIAYFDDKAQLPTNTTALASQRSRVLSFMQVSSNCIDAPAKQSLLDGLLSVLHRCIASETLGQSVLPVVSSKPMGGDPVPLVIPTEATEEVPKGRIARTLAELGALRSDSNKDTKNSQSEGENRHIYDSAWGGDGRVGSSVAMGMLSQSFQVAAKMVWLNPSKKRGNRRGRNVTHTIPIVIEPTTCLGALTEYAIGTANELGMSDLDSSSRAQETAGENIVTLRVALTIARTEVATFRLVYRASCERPLLECDDDRGGASLLQTLYGVHQGKSANGTRLAPSSNMWNVPHAVQITINCEPEPDIDPSLVPVEPLYEEEKSLLVSEKWWSEGNSLRRLLSKHLCPSLSTEQAAMTLGSSTLLNHLILLRILKEAVHYVRQEAMIGSLGDLDIQLDLLPLKGAWLNASITKTFEDQLKDPLVIACTSINKPVCDSTPSALPNWLALIARTVPFTLPLKVKQRWLHSTAFGHSHALRSLHQYDILNSKSKDEEVPLPPTAQRVNVMVDRQVKGGALAAALRSYRIAKRRKEGKLSVAEQLENETVNDWERGLQLEVTFQGEPGSGAGPTAEFFSLFSQEIATVSIDPLLWRDQPSSHDDKESQVIHPLFPWPLAQNLEPIREQDFSHIELLGCLGWLVMQSLQDGRLLDIPIARPLLSLLTWDDRHVSVHPLLECRSTALYQLSLLDPALAKQINQLLSIAQSSNSENDPISAMCLDWSLPGRPDVSLFRPQDNAENFPEEVNAQSLNMWVERVLEVSLLGNAKSSPLLQSFLAGASLVGDPVCLACFTPGELDSLVTGEDSDKTICPLGNDENTILASIHCAHGYDKSSSAILVLAKCLAEFDRKDQVAFLRFVTGSPRLPLGGLALLSPPLTVVKKTSTPSLDNTIQELPSAATCTNYLKLPDYGSLGLLKQRLLVAIHEGQGAFFLS